MSKRLAKNTLFLSISRVLERVFSIIFLAYAARVLGVEKLGIFSIVGTLLFFFQFIANLGSQALGIREFARNKYQVDKFFNNILTLRFLTSIFAFGMLVITIYLLNYPHNIRILVLLAGITLIFGEVSNCFIMLYMAYERMEIPTVLTILLSMFSSGLSILVLYLGYELIALILVTVITSVISVPLYALPVRKYPIRIRPQIDLALWKQLINWAIPLTTIQFLSVIHERIDVLMVSKLKGPVENNLAVGYYSPVYRLLGAVMIIPQNLRLSMMPRVAAQLDTSFETVRKELKNVIKLSAIFISFPLIIASTFFAPKIVTLFFGGDYLPSAKALTILGWGYAFQVLDVPMRAIFICFHSQIYKYIPVVALATALNILLNFILIPKYSYIGASIATLTTTILRFFIALYLLARILRDPDKLKP